MFIFLPEIVGVEPVEQSITCVRNVDEKSGHIQVTLSWKANFTRYPPSYYGDTLDYNDLSLFKAKSDSTSMDPDFRADLPSVTLISTNQEIRGLGSGNYALRSRDDIFAFTAYEVRGDGSGFISFIGLPPDVSGVHDHFLLLVRETSFCH